MALTKCKECGKEVSSVAEACPNCGAPIKPKPREYGCLSSILISIVGLFGFMLIFGGLFPSDAPKKKAQEIEACTNRGIEYFKAIGSYPTLKSEPNSGRRSDQIAREACTRTTGAFDSISDEDLRSLRESYEIPSNEEYARERKIAVEEEIEAQRRATELSKIWSDKEARNNCANDLHRHYDYPFAINTFMGMQPHENDTTLVGLALIDKRTEFEGKKVAVGCVYRRDGSLVTIFFNTKIADWAEPPKR